MAIDPPPPPPLNGEIIPPEYYIPEKPPSAPHPKYGPIVAYHHYHPRPVGFDLPVPTLDPTVNPKIVQLGRPPVCRDASELMKEFAAFLKQHRANPDIKVKPYSTPEGLVLVEEPKPRPLYLYAFRRYLGVTQQTWWDWANNRENLWEACEYIKEYCEEERLEGAAVGLYDKIAVHDLLPAAKAQVVHKLVPLSPDKKHPEQNS